MLTPGQLGVALLCFLRLYGPPSTAEADVVSVASVEQHHSTCFNSDHNNYNFTP